MPVPAMLYTAENNRIFTFLQLTNGCKIDFKLWISGFRYKTLMIIFFML